MDGLKYLSARKIRHLREKEAAFEGVDNIGMLRIKPTLGVKIGRGAAYLANAAENINLRRNKIGEKLNRASKYMRRNRTDLFGERSNFLESLYGRRKK